MASRWILLIPVGLAAAGCWDLKIGERPENGTDSQTEEWDTADPDKVDSPCYNVSCNDPPSDRCAPETGENAVIRYSRNGYCEVTDGGVPECVYPEYEDTCLDGRCDDSRAGKSVCPQIPKQATYCFTDPEPYCTGDNKLAIPHPVGAMTESGCVYDEIKSTVTCEEGCEKGRCRENVCVGKICVNPPAPFCHDGKLIKWAPVGRCTHNGTCRYIKREIECEGGCRDGSCTDRNRCDWQFCITPPVDFCIDENTLYDYESRGFCRDGACIYEGNRIDCEKGCENGHCKENVCLGVDCIYPVAPYCESARLMRFWDGAPFREQGTDDMIEQLFGVACQEGICRYEYDDSKETVRDCGEGGCRDGMCRKDSCSHMQLYCWREHAPAEYCDATTAVNIDKSCADSNCGGGKCEHPGYCDFSQYQKRESCDDQTCFAGQCIDPG